MMNYMPQDSYGTLLQELTELRKQIKNLEKKIRKTREQIISETDKSKIQKLKKSVGIE